MKNSKLSHWRPAYISCVSPILVNIFQMYRRKIWDTSFHPKLCSFFLHFVPLQKPIKNWKSFFEDFQLKNYHWQNYMDLIDTNWLAFKQFVNKLYRQMLSQNFNCYFFLEKLSFCKFLSYTVEFFPCSTATWVYWHLTISNGMYFTGSIFRWKFMTRNPSPKPVVSQRKKILKISILSNFHLFC